MEAKIALIDADSIIWTTAYLNREREEVDYVALDGFLTEMLVTVEATAYVGYMGNPTVRLKRVGITNSYKSQRPAKPDWFTKWESPIRQHLGRTWNFVWAPDGYEADDAVATAAQICGKMNTKYVVCGIDKDLKQIPGEHYDYRKKHTEHISIEAAEYYLFKQVFVGDSTDNIGGCPGIGPVKADKIITAGYADPEGSVLDYILSTYIEALRLRPGLAKFAETYLLVRLREDLDMTINPISFSPQEPKTHLHADPFQ